MKTNWEEIVNYALGLASAQESSRVESDPVALEQAVLLRKVNASKPPAVPAEFLARAKALLPVLPTQKVWKGILTFSTSGIGMRSTASAVRDYRFEFESAQVELRVEPIPKSNKLAVIGIFQAGEATSVRVLATKSDAVLCDESGQFEIVIDSDVRTLRFEDVQSSEIYEIEI
jgi:hypothetical protein